METATTSRKFQEKDGWETVVYSYDPELSPTGLEDDSQPLEPAEVDEVMREFTATSLAIE